MGAAGGNADGDDIRKQSEKSSDNDGKEGKRKS